MIYHIPLQGLRTKSPKLAPIWETMKDRLYYKRQATSATVLASKNSINRALQIELTLNAVSFQLCEER